MLLIQNAEFGEQIDKVLRSKESAIIRVKGTSMYPFIRDNRDLVTLKLAEANDLKPYQIVFFRYGNRYLLHRIIRVVNDVFYIRGDNRRDPQLEYVHRKDIIGYVAYVHRDGKSISCNNLLWRFCSFIWIKGISFRLRLYPFLRYVRSLFTKKSAAA